MQQVGAGRGGPRAGTARQSKPRGGAAWPALFRVAARRGTGPRGHHSATCACNKDRSALGPRKKRRISYPETLQIRPCPLGTNVDPPLLRALRRVVWLTEDWDDGHLGPPPPRDRDIDHSVHGRPI